MFSARRQRRCLTLLAAAASLPSASSPSRLTSTEVLRS